MFLGNNENMRLCLYIIYDNNFINESHLFTQGKTIVKAYTTTAREPSIYIYKQINSRKKKGQTDGQIGDWMDGL